MFGWVETDPIDGRQFKAAIKRDARTALVVALSASQTTEEEFNEWSDKLDDESNAVMDLIEAEQAGH